MMEERGVEYRVLHLSGGLHLEHLAQRIRDLSAGSLRHWLSTVRALLVFRVPNYQRVAGTGLAQNGPHRAPLPGTQGR